MVLVMDINASMEATLAKIIAMDAGNYVARKKLKLVRIAKALVPPQAKIENAVALLGEVLLDTILNAVLGRTGEKDRITLKAMVDPKTSPVVKVQRQILEMLQNFGRDSPHWTLQSLSREGGTGPIRNQK